MLVISDMMGTLTTGSPVMGLVDWVRHNQSKAQANLYMTTMLPGYYMAKRGLINWQKWGQELMVNSLGMIHQATPEKFAQVSEWAVEHNLWKLRRKDVIERLSAHARGGAKIYIASSVFEPGVQAFARRVGAQAIGTPVEYVNGRVRISSHLVSSEHKINEVLTRLKVSKIDFAYGDTMMDVPLLEHAEHPVAVYPDAKLRALALERGWEIMGSTPGKK